MGPDRNLSTSPHLPFSKIRFTLLPSTTLQQMSLPAQFQLTHRIGLATSKCCLEVYRSVSFPFLSSISNADETSFFLVDLICPFSAKIWRSLNLYVVPTIKEHPEQLSLVIRQLPQPWHSSSSLVHEAALAVAKVNPQKFQEYFSLIMEKQIEFYDESTSNETPNATRVRLIKYAESIGIDQVKLTTALQVGKGNSGTLATSDLKLQIRVGRQNGIHVTPTVLFDGLVDNSVSSSFSEEDWWRYMKSKNIV